MTSATPLSVMLTFFSKGKKGKEGAAEVMFERVTKITTKYENRIGIRSSSCMSRKSEYIELINTFELINLLGFKSNTAVFENFLS